MKLLLNLLINHLFSAGTLMFASTVLIPGAESSAESTESTEEIVDGGDTEETVEGDGADDGTTEETVEGDGTQPVKEETKVDWRTVSPEVKAHLQAISKENPKLGNLLQNAVYTSQTFMKEFPKGLKEAQDLKRSIDEAGGLEEIQNVRNNFRTLSDQQEALDTKARAGDPAALDSFLEIAGEGFPKLMPVALDKWLAADPAGYSHVMGKMMVAAMQEGGVVQDLNIAFKMLGLGNPEATKLAVESLKRVAEWANGVNDVATKAPEKPKVDPEIARQTQALEADKTKVFNDRFSDQFGSWRNQKIRDQVAILSKGKSLSEYQATTLGNRVVEEMRNILSSDPDYVKSLNKIHDSRNLAELLKFTKARTEKILPDAVKKVYRSLFADFSGKKKPETAKGKPNPGDKKTPAAPPVKGWTKVSADKAPSPDAIDGGKTDFKMKFNKQAILKDGRKVYWGDKVPS